MAAATDIQVIQADLSLPEHQAAILTTTQAYALDPNGMGAPLSSESEERLIDNIRAHPGVVVLLAYDGGELAGSALCVLSFSSFMAMPILNIHDLVVLPEKRGRGLGSALIQAAEQRAADLGCCDLSLEVSENNPEARRLYERLGFNGSKPGSQTFFCRRPLS
jgi:ribosomal protein S18 acetylase RimI-like enzyme